MLLTVVHGGRLCVWIAAQMRGSPAVQKYKRERVVSHIEGESKSIICKCTIGSLIPTPWELTLTV